MAKSQMEISEEAEDRGEVPVSPGDEDDPDGPEGDVADPGEEDEEGEDDPGEEIGIHEADHGNRILPFPISLFSR
jgi:hypothetical protein